MSKMPEMGPPEPIGTYQVWHKEGDGFRHVANVEAGNRLAALVLPYIKKDEVEYKRVTLLVDDARTITYGDVIVDPEHVAFEIYKPDFGGIGMRQVDFPQDQFKRILSEKINAGDGTQSYEKHLNEATERALARMHDKSGGHER